MPMPLLANSFAQTTFHQGHLSVVGMSFILCVGGVLFVSKEIVHRFVGLLSILFGIP